MRFIILVLLATLLHSCGIVERTIQVRREEWTLVKIIPCNDAYYVCSVIWKDSNGTSYEEWARSRDTIGYRIGMVIKNRTPGKCFDEDDPRKTGY